MSGLRTALFTRRVPVRMHSALLLSLLVHALLLSLAVGGQGFGLPGLQLPWKERRLGAEDLHILLAPAVPAPVPVPVPEPLSLPAPVAAPAPPAIPVAAVERRVEIPPARPVEPIAVDEQLRQMRQAADAQREAALAEAQRADAQAGEAARQEVLRLAEARQAQLESARQERIRIEKQLQEAARVEAVRQDAVRQEAARIAAAQQEALRQEASRQDAVRQEVARQEAARQEAARQEAARQEAAREEAARQEAARQEAARQAAARQQAARQESAKQEAAKQEQARLTQAEREKAAQEAEREERLRAIGRQLNAEAARREPGASNLRRGWLFGRADANADLVAYALAMSRKIELSLSFDQVRDVVKQPHTQPVVTVAVRADGTVEKVTFTVSSGVATIDEAIRKVIASQAPFGAFPPALAAQYDVVEIRRTWIFDMAIRLQ